MRRFALPLFLLCALLLGGCAAPPTSGGGSDANPAPVSTAPASPAPADEAPAAPPVTSPPANAPKPLAGGPVQLDQSCRTDADCTVKNVGNCCGYYPACVNVNSPTDPAAVQAECARTGMASVCGFPEISTCQCVSGSCKAQSSALRVPIQ